MSEVTVKSACAVVRRKMRAAKCRIEGIDREFGDVDSYLQRRAAILVQQVDDLLASFDREMRETVADG